MKTQVSSTCASQMIGFTKRKQWFLFPRPKVPRAEPPRASWSFPGLSIAPQSIPGPCKASWRLTNQWEIYIYILKVMVFMKSCSKPVLSLGFLVFVVSHCKKYKFPSGFWVFLVFSWKWNYPLSILRPQSLRYFSFGWKPKKTRTIWKPLFFCNVKAKKNNLMKT